MLELPIQPTKTTHRSDVLQCEKDVTDWKVEIVMSPVQNQSSDKDAFTKVVQSEIMLSISAAVTSKFNLSA